jgi:RecA-family ATPase
MQYAMGESFGPFSPNGTGKVLMLVAEEDREDIQRRLHALIQARMFTPNQIALVKERVGIVSVRGQDWRLMQHDDVGDIHETDRVDYIIDECKLLGDVRMVIFDPLVAFNGADENNNGEMAMLMRTLDRVAAGTGAAVVVIHHISKGGQANTVEFATQSQVRGASALVDNARAVLLLTRMPRAEAAAYGVSPEDAHWYVIARMVKNNYGPPVDDMIFRLEQGGTLRPAPEITRQHRNSAQAERAVAAADLERRALAAIAAAPSITIRAFVKELGLSGMSRGQRLLKELIDGNLILKTGVGKSLRHELSEEGRSVLGVTEEEEDLIG